jgi:uncharacterized protein (UPF0332 family)
MEQRSKIVLYWLDRAEERIEAAMREFEADSYIIAISHLYYSVFYAASAALIERDLSFRKHKGVKSAFHREFIRTGLLDQKWGELYDQLFEDRHEGDYIVVVEFHRDYVLNKISECKALLKAIKPLINSLHKDS